MEKENLRKLIWKFRFVLPLFKEYIQTNKTTKTHIFESIVVYTKTLCLTHIFNLHFDRKTKQKSLTISSPTTTPQLLFSTLYYRYYYQPKTQTTIYFAEANTFFCAKKRKQKNLQNSRKTSKQKYRFFFSRFFLTFLLIFWEKHTFAQQYNHSMYDFLLTRILILPNTVKLFFSKMLLRPIAKFWSTFLTPTQRWSWNSFSSFCPGLCQE